MRIGDLRVPFTLQSQDVNGDWSNVQSLWGSLDLYTNGGYSHLAVVRAFETSIVTGMRLAYGARYFLITKIEKVEEKDVWLRLFLQEEKKLG
ncbi:MAG: hypothetical protein AB7S81_05005 [Bdellovibrionales bacterium]